MANVDIQIGYKDSTWFTANATLVLKVGQMVYLQQTGTYKIGDGVTQLSLLSFLGAASNSLQIVSKDITDSVTLTGSTAITLMKSILIPANTYATGDVVKILNRAIRSTPGGTAINYFYINTTNSLTGATLVSTQNGAFRFYAMERNLYIKSTIISETIDVATSISSDANVASTSANSNLNIDWSVNQYIIAAFQNAAVGNSTVMSSLILQKF
jgi:hypothetical protein